MKRGSLRLRLLAAGAASILLALTLAGAGLLWLFERHVERRVVVELQSDLRQLVAGVSRGAEGAIQVSRPPAEPRFLEPLSGLYWQISGDPGQPALRSRSLWDAALELPPDSLRDGEIHRHRLRGPGGALLLAVERVVVLPESLGGGTIRVAVAVDKSELDAAAWGFGADLAPALGLLAAALIGAGGLQVTVGLWPLDAVRRRLEAVRIGRAQRLGGEFPDEVRPLATEVDTLLEAQEQAIAKARARAADLAHGLKTPLTVLATAAEELREGGNTAVAHEIEQVADGMRRHVERELVRARLGTGRRASPQPIRPVIERVLGVLRRTPRGQELKWQVGCAPGLVVAVDPEDLAEMLGNLAENAAKWAAGRVEIAAGRAEGAVLLTIADDGPGIAEEEVPAALRRGTRLDETRPGSGLGLAIVSDLAEAYGATLRLDRSPLGGLLAELRLPACG